MICKKIKNRLLFLYKEGLEDEEDLPMQKESLKSFLSFINSGLKLKDFGIVLSPNGTICISWKKNNDELINIDFINKESNYFIVYLPKKNSKNKFDKERIRGNLPIGKLINYIENLL